jgi:cephalosporin-C deacetylase-like acetyl esterase
MIPPRAARLAGPIAILLVLTACASPGATGSVSPTSVPSPTATPLPDLASLTTYDPTSPLDLRLEAEPVDAGDGVSVQDVSWASPGGGRVTAWLVVPAGDGPFAGIVYLHGSETDRDDLLDEAVAMAHGGAASLVLDAPFARRGSDRRAFLQYYSIPERERDMTAQAVVDVRRAYDLLSGRPDIDPARLGFVGHSWGASLGAVIAAVDPRPAALVLLSGRPSWTEFLATTTLTSIQRTRARIGEEDWQAYLRTMAPFDAQPNIAGVAAQRLYLQYGKLDDVVPVAVARHLVDAAPGAEVGWYDAGHALDEAATADRVAWLVDRLGLTQISEAVLATVGLPDE